MHQVIVLDHMHLMLKCTQLPDQIHSYWVFCAIEMETAKMYHPIAGHRNETSRHVFIVNLKFFMGSIL